MAIYHLSIKIFSRGKGASAVAKAAYRAAEIIKSEYDGKSHDYTRKKGVVHKEIMLPNHAPLEYSDRATLWNSVEKSERYKTAQLAREVEVALPLELTIEQNINLVKEYVNSQFVSIGMIADLCVHDTDGTNPHAHIMLTMRPIGQDGTWGQKSHTKNGRKVPTVDWNDRDKAEEWRAAWADAVNAALELHGSESRIDHRSYKRQGKPQIPTVHLGPAAHRMEQRGIRAERGDRNREVAVTNQKLRQLRARITKLQDWLDEATNTTEPSLQDIIFNILERQNRSTTTNLKDATNIFNFLIENNITDMAGLEQKVKTMHSQTQAIRKELKPIERRIKTLDEHIKQAEIFYKHEALYAQYQQEKNPKKRNTLYQNHTAEIILLEAADRYLKATLNGRTIMPLDRWRAELNEKIAAQKMLTQKYTALKDDARKVERIKRGVDDILQTERQRGQVVQTKNLEILT